MLSISLIYILIPFGLILLLAILFFFFNVFHIERYAIRSTATTTLVIIYFLSFGALLTLIGGYILIVDWSQEFEPNELLPSFDSSSQLD